VSEASSIHCNLETSWQKILEEEFQKPYMAELEKFLEHERSSNIPVYPPKEQIFNAFLHTPYDQVKVVIMGQDPYHGPGQAHGLCFSVQDGVKPPPSLQNIFKEQKEDLGIAIPSTGNLIPWADQGVLLLNAVLTVQENSPNSHQGAGWELFTDAVIARLCMKEKPVIFVLWGNYAQKKVSRILERKENVTHIVLTAAHPSPLSARRGFFGCRHFSKINRALTENKRDPINWCL
jgi:uracil-DNA glycosylase